MVGLSLFSLLFHTPSGSSEIPPPPPVYPSTQNPTLKNSSLIRGVQTLFEVAFKSPLMYVDILYSVYHSILTDIDVVVIFLI